VHGATRQKYHITRRRGERRVADEELQLAIDHVERLVGPFVDVRSGTAARRHRRLDQADLPAGLLPGQPGRADIAAEPERLFHAVREGVPSAGDCAWMRAAARSAMA
jgi:hypothetical protein